MKRDERAQIILEKLGKKYGISNSPLNHETVFQFLVAVILSAQCTDKRVNMVTPSLFSKFNDVNDFANASISEIREEIKSISFPNNKAKNIKSAAEMIVSDFGGVVPDEIEDIVKLPGVGRKTGNVIVGDYYKKPQGIVVDTHVGRLAVRIGLTSETDSKKAIEIEKDLMKIVKQEDWINFSLYLVFHGREICGARKAYCDKCEIYSGCKSSKKIKEYSSN